jgi:hypothetical protein
VICFIWLAAIPTDPKNAIVGIYSLQRILLLSVCAVLGFLFITLYIFIKRQGQSVFAFNFTISTSKLIGWLDLLLLIGILCSVFLVFIQPPAFLAAGTAAYNRILPLLLLGLLYLAQTFILITILGWQSIKDWSKTSLPTIRKGVSSQNIGYGLLILSALVGMTQVFYVYYNLGDEGDTIAVGWLISKGWVLYKDIFSHHFPLPYLWAGLVMKLFGATILSVRLSLILLRTFVFAVAMIYSRDKLALGITALAWSLVGHIYLGNGLLYHSFSGIFLVSAVAIGLTVMTPKHPISKGSVFSMGIFCGLLVLSDALKFLPAVALMGFVMLAFLINNYREKKFAQGVVNCLVMLAGFSLSVASYLLYALFTHSLIDFYQNAIMFNFDTYSKYTTIISIESLLQPLKSGLDISNPLWLKNLSPFYEWQKFQFFDQWLFSGFFYRLIILVGCIVSLIKRRFLIGFGLYFIAAMTMIRSTMYFHAAPFVLLALFISAWLITDRTLTTRLALTSGKYSFKSILSKIIWGVILLMFVWLNVRGGFSIFKDPGVLTYERNFGAITKIASGYKQLTCNRDDARLLVYPLNPIIYFFSQIPPASKYMFMTPWTAEIGQEEVINALSNQPTLIYIDRYSNVWNYPLAEYLEDLLTYLDQNYLPTDIPNVYHADDLQLCE